MPILEIIKSDIDFLKNRINQMERGVFKGVLTIINGISTITISSSGNILGNILGNFFKGTIKSDKKKLQELELLLESGIVPDKYFSTITNKTYLASPTELAQQFIAPAKYSSFTDKKSRKQEELKNSYIRAFDDKLIQSIDFYIEHDADKKYPSGSFAAKVKKGYATPECSEPKYAIKVFHTNLFNGNTIHELRLAMRSAYCYKALGRTGHTFRRNSKQYMVTDWLKGVNLNIASQEQIKAMPISRRIIMAISLLRELSILHKLGLIHHDIKPSNVMVNVGSLNFVDLDSVIPMDEPPFAGGILYTPDFLPSAQLAYDAKNNSDEIYKKFNVQTDMYAMGITLVHLFQEIYIPKAKVEKIPVNGGRGASFDYHTFSIEHGPKYNAHSELQKLLKNMIFHENPELTTADHYINALRKVLLSYADHREYLHEDRLAELSAQPFSIEDGKKAFKEIEIEILGFNSRADNFLRRCEINNSLWQTFPEAVHSLIADYDPAVPSQPECKFAPRR